MAEFFFFAYSSPTAHPTKHPKDKRELHETRRRIYRKFSKCEITRHLQEVRGPPGACAEPTRLFLFSLLVIANVYVFVGVLCQFNFLARCSKHKGCCVYVCMFV